LQSSNSVCVGLVANPASGHDVRRLVSGASVFTNSEKVHVIRRLLSGLGASGVDRVVMMPDNAGLSLGVQRAIAHHRPVTGAWPTVELLDLDMRHTVADSIAATSAMVASGVGALVVLGGDGTARAVAMACGDTPLLALSTGTNNAFGSMMDATIAGQAVGLVASGLVGRDEAGYRAKTLVVRIGDRTEIALVDVAVIDGAVGSRAVWDPSLVRELAVTFAEPHGVGLSAIVGAIAPCDRLAAQGRHVVMGDGGGSVTAALAPGLMCSVSLAQCSDLLPGQPVPLVTPLGVIAFDGEREITFDHRSGPVTVELCLDGPRVIDAVTVMALAAERCLFRR
jgi:predicted polyphosphate/ATP-dependent NAD kinase